METIEPAFHGIMSKSNKACLWITCFGLAFLLLNSKLTCPNRYSKPIPSFERREELGDILEIEGFTSGVEIGVQKGKFSESILSRWKSANKYVLVDIWRKQSNYFDSANKDNEIQLLYKQEALSRLEKFKKLGVSINVCHDESKKCAKLYPKPHFDFIYVDARHDYKGVLEDLNNWWPLLNPGGIMAGHDYLTSKQASLTGQNWSVSSDGTVDHRAVKGAVDDFMYARNLQISVSYHESNWNSWAVRKPRHSFLKK